MNKEYTYSMPESFLKDQSVPARWRVLGIINGFAIAGKPCYASNKWFSKELVCSIHTISNAFSELEEKEEIYCIRTRRTRIAYRIKPEIEVGFHLRPQPTELSDGNQLNTISDSNSDSKLSESKDSRGGHSSFKDSETYTTELDGDGMPVRKSKAKPDKLPEAQIKSVFDLFTPTSYSLLRRNKTQRDAVKGLLEAKGFKMVQNALGFYKEHKDEQFCPKGIVTPYDLSAKWDKLLEYKNKS